MLFHLPVPFIYCLLFGSLISPTDPIAVLAILKQQKIPESLELKISGESLFNDGVAVVIFITIAEVARSGNGDFSFLAAGKLFLQEAGGGIIVGGLLGYLVLITLAIVMGGYFTAGKLHISGPLAMVVAGIITGNKVKEKEISDESRDYLGKFWELIDEILNAVLFMLIGLEMLIIKVNATILLIGFITTGLTLAARWISVIFPVFLLRYKIRFERNAVAVLTWGGLRGGLSVAMALSLGAGMHRDEFVLITCMIVVFPSSRRG
jgi:CPA1 family monovalent cation:H+ antiporter